MYYKITTRIKETGQTITDKTENAKRAQNFFNAHVLTAELAEFEDTLTRFVTLQKVESGEAETINVW